MEFRPPKVKRLARFRPERCVPYPESLKNVTNYQGTKAVLGKYNGSNVVIDNPEMTQAIYNLGCFGKGSLSRGEPNFYLRSSEDQQRSSNIDASNDKSNKNTDHAGDNAEHAENRSEDCIVTTQESATSEHQDKLDTDHGKNGEDTNTSQAEDKICLLRTENEEFKLQETLHLNLEEAYFLSYGLGCLEVVDLFDKTLSLQESWELFCESQDDFVQKYVVYHYYRTKGWVVKPGLKFGGDFVLYKWGANISHASYIVVIEVIRPDGNISEDHQQAFTWTKFISLNRMAETAGKEVILCRVVWPQDVLFKDVNSPEDIKKFSIEEILTKRWVSSQEREILDKEELE